MGDWRLFVRPTELESALVKTGFRDFEYAGFEPSLRALVELSLFARGLMSPAGMRGGWRVEDSPSILSSSYIGFAVKEQLRAEAPAPCVQVDGHDTCAAGRPD